MAAAPETVEIARIEEILGPEGQGLLAHECKTISRDRLAVPGPDFVDRIFQQSDRSVRVLGALQTLMDHGRLGGTGYVSILPVDQGIEHSAGASFAPNPDYFDPAKAEFGGGVKGKFKSGDDSITYQGGMGMQGLSAANANHGLNRFGIWATPPELNEGKDWKQLGATAQDAYRRRGWTEQEWTSKVAGRG